MKNKDDLYAIEIRKREFRVAVFGSARIKRNDKTYKQIKKLGEMLGERGIDIVTGGGPGLMEAASIGHRSKKTRAQAIGLNIKLPREQKPNKYTNIKKEFKIFSRRLDNFMLLSNAVVVANGGVGTLLELFYTWQLVQVEQVCNIPIILMGDMWKGLIKWLEKEPLKKKYFSKKDLQLLFVTENCNQTMEIVDKAFKAFKEGNKNFCLNYKKYKI